MGGHTITVLPDSWATNESFFAYSGEAVADCASPVWTVVSASVTGPSHINRGKGCDDAAAAAVIGDWLVAVVCDGAGSAEFGADGSALASRSIMKHLAEHLARDLSQRSPRELQELIEQSLEDARQRILDLAEERGTAPNSVATTIVGALLHDRSGLIFHIGDGAAIALDHSLQVMAISLGSPKEYANETYFLSDSCWLDNLQFTPVRPVERLLLMTDGVTPFAVEGCEGKQDFIEPIARFMLGYPAATSGPALQRLLNRSDACSQVSDDKTLLWAALLDAKDQAL